MRCFEDILDCSNTPTPELLLLVWSGVDGGSCFRVELYFMFYKQATEPLLDSSWFAAASTGRSICELESARLRWLRQK